MKLTDRWRSIAVLGACGKMGSGIALLLLQELALDIAQGVYKPPLLMLIDSNSDGFEGLQVYLREHLRKYAEKHLSSLHLWNSRRSCPIDSAAMVDAFISEALEKVRCETQLESCREAALVFETIDEDIEKKVEILHKANTLLKPDAYFLTNTSSVPIHYLQDRCYLEGRLLGFHFYNPPAVQKLVEIVVPDNVEPALLITALDLAKRLKKTVVYAHDIAGFIGNGFFIREIEAACQKVQSLLKQSIPHIEAVFGLNRVTQEFLLRPMGIFQLIDYVGIETVNTIATNMGLFLPDSPFNEPLIQSMLEQGVKGGQYSDGSQRDGFFQYENGKPVAVYDLNKKSYVPCRETEEWRKKSDRNIGELPAEWHSWKTLRKDPERKEKIAVYFTQLWQSRTNGSEIAHEFLIESRRLAHFLVENHVADSIEDVNAVLQEGFFHLYSVDEPFMAIEIASGKG